MTEADPEGGPLRLVAQGRTSGDLWTIDSSRGQWHRRPPGGPVRVLDGAAFMGAQEGLLVLQKGNARIHRVPNGPGVKDVTVVAGSVFVTGEGLYEFDPASGTFETIASPRSAAPRNPIDGAVCRISQIVADHAFERLYVVNEGDRKSPAAGVWYMNPRTREFHFVTEHGNTTNLLLWIDEELVTLSNRRVIDRTTGTLEEGRFWPPDWPEEWRPHAWSSVRWSGRLGAYHFYPHSRSGRPRLVVDGKDYWHPRLGATPALWIETDYGVWYAVTSTYSDDGGPVVYRLLAR